MEPPSDVELESEMDFDENAPLLSGGSSDDESQIERQHRQAPPAVEQPDAPLPTQPSIKAARWQAKTPKTIVLLAATLKFCIVCCGMLMLIPIYRLLEDALCHNFYDDDSPGIIDEMKCKVDEVQANLAVLLGWLGLAQSITTLLVAFPFGMLADRIGRKPTALFAYSGLATSFCFGPLMLGLMRDEIRRNPYLLLMGNIFTFFGGGVPVLLATLYAMAADVSTEKEKAASFLYLTFGATAGGLIGPLIAGILMTNFGPWVPIYVVVAVTPLVLCLFFFIPETLNSTKKASYRKKLSLGEELKERVAHGIDDLRQAVDMLKNVNIPLVLLTFLFQSARFTAYTSILAQYMSKHFGWKLAQISVLLSPLGLLNLGVLAALPHVSKILVSGRFKFTVFGKDLFLTQVSTALTIIGAIIEACSRNVGLFLFGLFIGTFGAADSPLARATVTHYVEPENTSKLYALIGMLEVLGSFLGAPVLAFLFSTGLKRKGAWISLPWWYVGALCAIALVALFFIRPPKKRDEEQAQDTLQTANGVANESTMGDPLRPE